jgi:hypothetical protein
MNTPDFEQIKQLYRDLNADDATDETINAVCRRLDQLVSSKCLEAMDDLEPGPTFDVDLQRVFSKFYPDSPVQESSSPIEEFDLLPFDLYDRRRQEALPIDGYEIDQWDRPHGTGGQRRKRGALTRQRFWRKTKDGKKQFFHGYRMTIRGKRKWVTDRSLSLARFNAERKRDGQDSYF